MTKAAHEEGGGGLRTITFAAGKGTDIDDLNPSNLADKWASIAFEGTTQIMPGVAALFGAYNDEFGDRSPLERPRLLMLVITDGEADDSADFAKLMQSIGGNMFVEIALLGYGPDHDDALNTYQGIAAQNKHVHVTSFGNATDPQAIADALVSMIA